MEFEMVPSDLDKGMNRRRLLRLVLGAAATAVAGGVLRGEASASSGSQYFRSTAALNLRAKASSSGKILLVIPANALVTNLAKSSNGYNKVSYQGTNGWAYGVYLEDANSGSDDPEVNWLGQAKTATSVNFRYGPSTGDGVIQVLKQGSTVDISDWVENGYRYVDRSGTRGWIYDQYLSQVRPSGAVSFVTTANVNLREEPSLSAKVIMVVPEDSTVLDYDLVMSGAFRGVEYKGVTGWISDAYLAQR